MIDWSQPRSLAQVTDDAGFTMSDLAFVAGLDESTVSRLWDNPHWLDRVSGRSLQSLIASVPGIAEYVASHSMLSRRNNLVEQLEDQGITVNRAAIVLSARTDIPHQYLFNALEAALNIMRGDDRKVSSCLPRFWGVQQNRALEYLFAPTGNQALLKNPQRLVSASVTMMPRLDRKGYSFHSILAKATFAHHVGIAKGELNNDFVSPITDRQSAFMVRSGIMGMLISSGDIALARQYEKMVESTPVLRMIEEWSFPTYTRDNKPNADFSLPKSILLRRTANEILHELDHYTDAYIYYLCRTYLPLALAKDPTFGLKLTDLRNSLIRRADTCKDATVRNTCILFARQLKEKI